ncbi:MAG TPA: hypothetical protein VK541_12915 [Pedobacter sp.]|uniref:hypothetical protein n=1 Tax=Pedobacter sp. TaxID=1411316 RepID=UPI002BEC5B74|nr:hypothetical protein [Pedobacter sp.]HMI03383.1 hypothetical protein [Pedobacter sp.]
MKKLVLSILALVIFHMTVSAQETTAALQSVVTKLDQAKKAKDYEALEKEFLAVAEQQKSWLPYYYAAFCNAKVGFINQDDGESIEPYSIRGEEQVEKAKSMLDTVRQKKELSELFTVLSMVYRTKVFINPMTYGRKYGILSQQYRVKAQELDPENPRALYVQAWELYKTPKMWGGDKEAAKKLSERSLALLQNTKADVNPHWGKAENEELTGKNK